MKKIFLFFLVLVFSCTTALATWSIIIIDRKTHEIGIAGASCTYNCDGIGKIVPNLGAVIVQAMSNSDAREKGVQMILADSSPDEIIKALRNPKFSPEFQQYAVVTINYILQPAGYTGDSTTKANGLLTLEGVSVQGNTLANENELQLILASVQEGQRDSLQLSEILMNALEAGSKSGGDKRCGDQRSTSAFLIVAQPDDKRPSLHLNIFGQSKGGQNAVDMLRKKFDRSKRRRLGKTISPA